MSEYVVSTASGKVEGHLRDGLVMYLGIPYAQPPVGELRFRRARPVTPWTGVLDAADYGPEAVQLDQGVVKGSEDCLTLNIVRPPQGDRLPVLVFLHGGGFNTGSCRDPLYGGHAFAREGIVYVSFQYRLNVLGFYDFTTYPGCEDLESNCGLSDQIAAMQWIHQNIQAFGGDPQRVTICGESAGACSVLNLMASPAARGTFQQAIAESALPNCVLTHQTARENIDLFLEGMGWTQQDLGRLRTDDPVTFLSGNTYVSDRHQYKNPGIYLPGPVQDDLLPVRPIDAIRAGSAAGIRLIIGTNANEGSIFVHPEKTGFPNSWEMIARMFDKNGYSAQYEQIRRHYSPEGEQAQPAQPAQPAAGQAPGARARAGMPFVNFATDYAFRVPAVQVADGQQSHCPDVWLYRYDLVTRFAQATGLGAAHAFELPAMFADMNAPLSRFMFQGESPEAQQQISDALHGDWVRFVKTGNPNPDWPRYTGHTGSIRVYDRQTGTRPADLEPLMQLWGDLRFYQD